MKITPIFLFCALGFIKGYAQVEFSFSNLRYKDSAVVYRGIENSIALKNLYLDSSVHSIKAFHGQVFWYANSNHFRYKPTEMKNGNDTIILYENEKEIGRRIVEIRKIPNPSVLLLGQISGMKISRHLILAAPYFVVVYKGFLFDAYDYPKEVYIRANNGEQTFEYVSHGGGFPDGLVALIKNSKSKITLDCQVYISGTLSCITRVTSFYCEIF